MKLSKFIEDLQEVMEVVGGEVEVIYAKDSEGNGFEPVYYDATAGHYEDGEFTLEVEENVGEIEINAVCIN